MTTETPDPSPLSPLPGDFLDDLRLFVHARVDRLDPARESEEYAALDMAYRRLMDEVEAAVPEDGRAMLGELRECYTSLAALAMEICYWRGFVEGAKQAVARLDGRGSGSDRDDSGDRTRDAGLDRVNLRQKSREYADMDDASMRLLEEIGVIVDVETGRQLDRIDGMRVVMMGMVKEMVYEKGLREGMGVMAISEKETARYLG